RRDRKDAEQARSVNTVPETPETQASLPKAKRGNQDADTNHGQGRIPQRQDEDDRHGDSRHAEDVGRGERLRIRIGGGLPWRKAVPTTAAVTVTAASQGTAMRARNNDPLTCSSARTSRFVRLLPGNSREAALDMNTQP